MPRLNECSICTHPVRREFVNRRLAEGYSPNRIEVASKTQEARDKGIPHTIKGETIIRHKAVCLAAGLPATASTAVVADVVRTAAKVSIGEADPQDVARLIRDQVSEKLKAGDLRVTAQHGLQAQQMLDRRAEKAGERQLALTLARMLTGAEPPSSILPPTKNVTENIIEAAYEEL